MVVLVLVVSPILTIIFPHHAVTDIDECAENSSLCPRFIKKCVNTDGGYRCNCSDGLQENAETGTCEGQWEGVGVRLGDSGSRRVCVRLAAFVGLGDMKVKLGDMKVKLGDMKVKLGDNVGLATV